MKKLILAVLFALVAASCGGSDDAASPANAPSSDSDPAADAVESEPESESSAGAATDSAAEEEAVDLPNLLESVPVQVRECAHSVDDLADDSDVDADDDADVVLPPDVKPEVGDEFLGPVDELIVTDLIEGSGREAVSGATVEMEYIGVLGADGTEFDSSWDPADAPFSFALGTGRVITGWDEGIQGMKAGGRRVLQIPSDMAYGDQDRSEIIVANSDLVFIVDLISVSAAAEPAPVAEKTAAPAPT